MSESAENLRLVTGGGSGDPSKPADPLIGKVIDARYRVEELLGEGGMGIVYKCRHIVLNKPLAMKVLRSDISGNDEIIARFRQEAQSASAIGNQHIIDIVDFGALSNGSTYFVMEYLHGSHLGKVIEAEHPIDTARCVHIAKQLCRALGAAHERGIVHRDLKPDNIYLIERGGDRNFVKVLDFGIAKVAGTQSKLTRAGQVFGTPHYMSPEQCAGTTTDFRTDIYALGVILYEMAVGRVPFDADTLMGVLTKHMYEEPTPLHKLVPPPNIPPAFENVILRCLAKKPEDRYQSMDALYDELDTIPHTPITTGRSDPTGRTSREGIARHIAEPRSDEDETVSTGLSPIVKVLIALGLVGAVGAGIAVFAMPGKEDPKPPARLVNERTTAPQKKQPPIIPTPQPPQRAQQQVEERPTGGTPSAKVTVHTEPEGAEVWRGEELIGNTPLEFPRPEAGQRLEIELRRPGFKSQAVRISPLAHEQLTITMEADRTAKRGSNASRSNPPSHHVQQTASPQQPQQPQTPTKARGQQTEEIRTLGTREVVNPWAYDE